MVGLTDGSWREVRTLAIGTVERGSESGAVRCTDCSYFSRLAEAAVFTEQATGEVHRRGVETAAVVAGVSDGAPWCQTFLDTHRPDAVRILDCAHAAQRLRTVADAVWGDGEPAAIWAAEQRRELRDGDPVAGLAAIQALPVAASADPALAAQVQAEVLGYLGPRREQLQYATFRAQGLPIGSGIVESATKLVVEARLKGAGRRWAEANVNPLLALRGTLCSGRWSEAWTAIARARRPHGPRPGPTPDPVASASSVVLPVRRAAAPAIGELPRCGPKTIVNGRPTGAHPWKRDRLVQASPAKQ